MREPTVDSAGDSRGSGLSTSRLSQARRAGSNQGQGETPGWIADRVPKPQRGDPNVEFVPEQTKTRKIPLFEKQRSLRIQEAMTIHWNELKSLIETHQRFLLTSHVRPDCDALGSELGLAGILEAMGKQVTILNADPTPPHLAFIDPECRIQSLVDDQELPSLNAYEAIIVLDTSAWNQLGGVGELLRTVELPIIVIDHHANAEELGTAVFKDPTAEATGRLVTDLADFLRVSITKEMAMPLFAAVATDTGWYRFPSTTGETYRVAARLVDAGAEPSIIFRELYEQDSLARVRLRGLALSRVVTELDGRLAHTYVRADDFTITGAFPGDTEDFINMALAVAGTEAAVIMIERPEGQVKASFRSRSGLDCSQIAASFGGGGHKAAAGATLEGPFERAQAKVLEAMRRELVG